MTISSMDQLVEAIVSRGIELNIGPYGTFTSPDTVAIFQEIDQDVRIPMLCHFEHTVDLGVVIDPDGEEIDLMQEDFPAQTWILFKYDSVEVQFSFVFPDGGEVYDVNPKDGSHKVRDSGYFWFEQKDIMPFLQKIHDTYPAREGYDYQPSEVVEARGESMHEWYDKDRLALVCQEIKNAVDKYNEPLQRQAGKVWGLETEEELFKG